MTEIWNLDPETQHSTNQGLEILFIIHLHISTDKFKNKIKMQKMLTEHYHMNNKEFYNI